LYCGAIVPEMGESAYKISFYSNEDGMDKKIRLDYANDSYFVQILNFEKQTRLAFLSHEREKCLAFL
jgi:hypothetical protein